MQFTLVLDDMLVMNTVIVASAMFNKYLKTAYTTMMIYREKKTKTRKLYSRVLNMKLCQAPRPMKNATESLCIVTLTYNCISYTYILFLLLLQRIFPFVKINYP